MKHTFIQPYTGIAGKFMKAAYKKLVKDGLKPGDKVPDVFGKISEDDKVTIFLNVCRDRYRMTQLLQTASYRRDNINNARP